MKSTLNRRHLLASAAAFGATSFARAQPTSAPPDQRPRNFVLVHGAWHGGWCWSRVADRLRARQHRVFTPTLTGLGERRHLLAGGVNLDTHIQDVVGLIEAEELDDLVLVGHSYAGVVVSGVADRIPQRLRHLVYLDAILLENGRSMVSLLPTQAAERLMKTVHEAGGGIGLPPTLTPAAFGVVDPADAAWVARRMTPQPIGTYQQALILKAPLGNGAPRTYIDCTRDPIANLQPIKAGVRAGSGWQVKTLDAGHDAMITAPAALAGLLQDIAG